MENIKKKTPVKITYGQMRVSEEFEKKIMSYENNFEAVIDLDNKLKNKICRSQNARY